MSWQKKALVELVSIRTGKLNSNAALENGDYPFFTCAKEVYRTNTCAFDTEAVLLGGNNASAEYPIFYFNGAFDAYQRTYVIEPFDRDDLDTRFLYYCLSILLPYFKSLSIGAATKFLTLKILNSTFIQCPSIDTQRRIASILSAYDDLIENNLKRIKLLEEAAQNIYREWFVEMRFPDHEKVEWYTDENGRRLPLGWKYAPLSDMCELTMGQSPKSEFYNDNHDGMPFHQGVTGYGFRFVEDSTYCTMPTRIANEGDILCSVRAPVGRLNITMNKIIIGRGLSAIRNRQGFQSFQYYQLKSHFYQEDLIGGGAIFNSVTKKVLSEQILLLPNTKYLKQFEIVGNNIDHQIQNLSIQNQRLKEARDLLLPRLLNQTIEV